MYEIMMIIYDYNNTIHRVFHQCPFSESSALRRVLHQDCLYHHSVLYLAGRRTTRPERVR